MGLPSRQAFYALPETVQEEWIAAWEAEGATCSFHGGPVSECGDDDKDWFPQRSTCWPTAQLEAAKALYAQLHEKEPHTDGAGRWAKERSMEFPFHFADGQRFWLSPVELNPEDDFLQTGSSADSVQDRAQPD